MPVAPTQFDGSDELRPAVSDQETLDLDPQQRQQAQLLSSHSARPPASVPGYICLGQLGEGAFGTVWLAREHNTGKLVAIKFYSHRRGLDWTLLSREVEKLAVLYTSRNIVGLLGVGWTSEPPYYVMEYLENGSLDNLLQAGPLTPLEVQRIVTGVLQGLIHAHGSGILHCDLKPANVLLDQDFEPRLCDFGQSRLSYEQDPALGTLFYMAPEQADLSAIPDARWDVYALGALMYHMLVGVPPYKDEDNEQLVRAAGRLEQRLTVYRQIFAQSPRPTEHRKVAGVDKRLAEIIDRCLHVDPNRRFPNAQAVHDALELRARQRSRRPLLALGIFGPLLLMLLMTIMVGAVLRDAVNTAQSSVTDQALISASLPARILARSLEIELESRSRELQRLAADPQLRKLLAEYGTAPIDQRGPLIDFLNQMHAESQSHLVEIEQDASWFVTDVDGYQRWRMPWSDVTIDRQYAHRDYFHGLQVDLPNREASQPPIRRPHVSIAFQSEATQLYIVAISVPVWDEAHERVLGVLARTQEIGQLQREYGRRMEIDGKTGQRVTAIVDRRAGWNLLDHPWMTQQNLQQHADSLSELSLDAEIVFELEQVYGTADRSGAMSVDYPLREYQDPVGDLQINGTSRYQIDWLAAVCPIGETGWFAVIQEPKAPVLQPVVEMRNGLIQFGLWALAVCFGLIGLLWFFVLRAINNPLMQLSPRRTANGGRQRPSST